MEMRAFPHTGDVRFSLQNQSEVRKCMMKKICLMAVLVLTLALSACGKGREAEPAVQATVAVSANPAPVVIQAESSGRFATPCIEAPYDREYYGDDKQIVIRRFEQSSITYFVADVQLTDASQFQTALCGENLERLSAMAEHSGAVLAINADDYNVHKYGTIIRNGNLLRIHATTRNMLIVDANGVFTVLADRAGENPEELSRQLMEIQTWQTFEFGPELVRDGQTVAFSPDFDLISTNPERREPRTAIGQIGPLHYVIIVADGRQSGYSRGMTLPELQRLFIGFGAQTAMNLDGGGSTELWFQGEVINRPSEGRERRLSDIIFFWGGAT